MAQAKQLIIPETPAAALLPQYVDGVPRTDLGADSSTIGNQRRGPLILYGIFLEIIRGCYSPAFEQVNGGRRVWRPIVSGVDARLSEPDRSKTDIWIDTEYRWEDQTPKDRPAIYVSLTPLVFSSYTGNYRSLSGGDLSEGEQNYSRTVQGMVSFLHLGETRGEGVILASNTYDILDGFTDVIRRDYCFDKFNLTGLTPLQLVGDDEYRSIVTAMFEFQETWTIKRESPKLKAFTFRTGQPVE